MDDRERILADLPPGLGDSPPEVLVESRPMADLWLAFEENLARLGGQMLPPQALPLLLNRGFWADDDVATFPNLRPAPSVWEAEVGIGWAEFAIAETGTIVLAAGPGRSRLTSLAPPVNVVLIKEEAIVASLSDAFARIPEATAVLITGTSRTADIEGVLVRGVHGPRELYVVRL